jgi:hypothetical protein
VKRTARVLGIVAQWLAIGAGVWFLVATARTHWTELTQIPIAVRWGPLAIASLLTATTYVYLVAVWTRTLRWWSQTPAFRTAVRIWFLANLARYIPGTVWQFVGLAAMSRRAGIAPGAATGAVLLQQLVLLATGIAITAGLAPQFLGPWAGRQSRLGVVLLVGISLLVLTAVLPWAGRLVRTLGARFGRETMTWPDPPKPEFAGYVAALTVPWFAYGVAFHLFAAAMFGGNSQIPLETSVAAFVGSYVAGLIAVFAPGGLVVRETALVLALTGAVGAERALFLSVGSRLWLVSVELLTALGVLAVHRITRDSQEDVGA